MGAYSLSDKLDILVVDTLLVYLQYFGYLYIATMPENSLLPQRLMHALWYQTLIVKCKSSTGEVQYDVRTIRKKPSQNTQNSK